MLDIDEGDEVMDEITGDVFELLLLFITESLA